MVRESRDNNRMQESLAVNSDYKRTLLHSLDLFKGVFPDDIHELLQRCDRRDIVDGELLLSPGEVTLPRMSSAPRMRICS